MRRWIALTACVLVPAALAAPMDGTVERVVDGDTLVLDRVGAEPLKVRVQGIDAPEICQPHGPQAKLALEEMVLKQPVRVLTTGQDQHGRTLGKLMKGELDVGDRLVRDGHAWSQRYRSDRGPYMASERLAHALRRGLHADGAAIEPREFRKRHGSCPLPVNQSP